MERTATQTSRGRTRTHTTGSGKGKCFGGAVAGLLLTTQLIAPALATTGTIDTYAGGGLGDMGPAMSANLYSASSAVDIKGNLFIADSGHDRIRKVDTSGIISTVAGSGNPGFSGDGGPAVAAEIYAPRDVTVDGSGNLLIADTFNHRIRKVDATGTITTIAGTGTSGYSGDSGPATNAKLSHPLGLAIDASGNLFIADSGNHRIRKVDPQGTITTFAGGGGRINAGWVPATPTVCKEIWWREMRLYPCVPPNVSRQVSAGPVEAWIGCSHDYYYYSRCGFSTIATIDGPPATLGILRSPADVAVDPKGNLLIADTGNHMVKRVDQSGFISTVVGTGQAGYSGDGGPASEAQVNTPQSVAMDSSGHLLIADTYNHRIRQVDALGRISTIAGDGVRGFAGDGGSALNARLSYPFGVSIGTAGDVYITDAGNLRTRAVDAFGIIRTVAGNGYSCCFAGDGGPAGSSGLYEPMGVALDGFGNLFIADTKNHRIRKIDVTGTISTFAGNGTSGFSGDQGPSQGSVLNSPSGVAIDDAGNIYIADTSNHRIRMIDKAGTITTIGGNGTGGFSGDGGAATKASLNFPYGVAIGPSGEIFIADTGNNRIRKIDEGGIISTVAGGNGYCCFRGDGVPATSASIDRPSSIAVDKEGNLFIADTMNHRIRKVDNSGIISTLAGNGAGWNSGGGFSGDGGPATDASLSYPRGVALDASGNLYISDTYNHRIRMVDTSGTITTIAGSGWCACIQGDGGPATSASLNKPHAVALGAGNMFIADTMNNRIRVVTLS